MIKESECDKMKNKIISFIINTLTMLIIGILCFLGIIIYKEFTKSNIASQVEEFVSNITTSSEELKKETNEQEIIQIEANNYELNNTNLNNKNNENIQINKYFYNQLDEYSKLIYNALENNKENMKTGTYEINLEPKLSQLLSKDKGEENLKQYYQTAIEAYTHDNPDIFYIEFSKLYLNIETTTRGNQKTYKVFINSGNENNYLKQGFSSKESINKSINEIEKIREYFIQNKSLNTYENIKMIHDYLIESIEYDQTLSKANIYNIYGALINKECVCEGYAKAFEYLANAINIPCIIISGTATNSEGNMESHAWNYVLLDEKWYAVDCTWDDPILINGGFLTNLSKYKYFLKGENEFNKTHIPNGQFSENGKVFEFPNLSPIGY